jgi:hypothetical protein
MSNYAYILCIYSCQIMHIFYVHIHVKLCINFMYIFMPVMHVVIDLDIIWIIPWRKKMKKAIEENVKIQ